MPSVLEPSWIGRRVTVRRAVGRGPDGAVQLADSVGDLVALDGVSRRSRHGAASVSRSRCPWSLPRVRCRRRRPTNWPCKPSRRPAFGLPRPTNSAAGCCARTPVSPAAPTRSCHCASQECRWARRWSAHTPGTPPGACRFWSRCRCRRGGYWTPTWPSEAGRPRRTPGCWWPGWTCCTRPPRAHRCCCATSRTTVGSAPTAMAPARPSKVAPCCRVTTACASRVSGSTSGSWRWGVEPSTTAGWV